VWISSSLQHPPKIIIEWTPPTTTPTNIHMPIASLSSLSARSLGEEGHLQGNQETSLHHEQKNGRATTRNLREITKHQIKRNKPAAVAITGRKAQKNLAGAKRPFVARPMFLKLSEEGLSYRTVARAAAL
jgi:hypothetical protein